MYKYIIVVGMAFIGFLHASTAVRAAVPALDIRIQQPKSPTNQSDLKVNFVALDRLGRVITVKCFKKGPSDGAFAQFGSDITTIAGGNSSNCEPSSILTSDGTYLFLATAQAGADTATSPTVTVDYHTSGPGTPSNYSKDKTAACSYTIKFKTADDAGKTVKVELYRSDNTAFTADSSTRVGTLPIGSNLDGQFVNDIPDCNKTFYYALRAFDSAGNDSGVVGDSVVTIVTTTSTSSTTTITTTNTTTGTAGRSTGNARAIPVAPGAGGNILGEQTGTQSAQTGGGSTLGEASESANATPSAQKQSPAAAWFTPKNLLLGGVTLLVLSILGWLVRRRPLQQ